MGHDKNFQIKKPPVGSLKWWAAAGRPRIPAALRARDYSKTQNWFIFFFNLLRLPPWRKLLPPSQKLVFVYSAEDEADVFPSPSLQAKRGASERKTCCILFWSLTFFFVSLNFISALKNSGLNADTLSHVSELEVTWLFAFAKQSIEDISWIFLFFYFFISHFRKSGARPLKAHTWRVPQNAEGSWELCVHTYQQYIYWHRSAYWWWPPGRLRPDSSPPRRRPPAGRTTRRVTSRPMPKWQIRRGVHEVMRPRCHTRQPFTILIARPIIYQQPCRSQSRRPAKSNERPIDGDVCGRPWLPVLPSEALWCSHRAPQPWTGPVWTSPGGKGKARRWGSGF